MMGFEIRVWLFVERR